MARQLFDSLITYKTPLGLTSLWNLGFLAGICTIIQIITGLLLTMSYTGDIEQAFSSIEKIVRDVNAGWLLRYIHANGASLFFTAVYLHICRGSYFGSYKHPRHHVWLIGTIIYILMIATAFFGYVLPWGQMSFWAATVITNLFSAIPIIGQDIVSWLWGGFSVSNATLHRFYSLHFVLPFLILALILVHLVVLHAVGSSNPLGIKPTIVNLIPFHPQFTYKDFSFVALVLIGFLLTISNGPDVGSHPDNYIPANPLATPAHIVPEWYFLPYYAILRSIPDKLFGVCALALAICLLLITPITGGNVIQSGNQAETFLFWISFLLETILGWIGGMPIEVPYLIIGQVVTTLFFLINILRPYLLSILPSMFELD